MLIAKNPLFSSADFGTLFLLPGNAPCNTTKGVTMKTWVCNVCGYVHVGDEPPETCPLCYAKKERFQRRNDLNVEEKTTTNKST